MLISGPSSCPVC